MDYAQMHYGGDEYVAKRWPVAGRSYLLGTACPRLTVTPALWSAFSDAYPLRFVLIPVAAWGSEVRLDTLAIHLQSINDYHIDLLVGASLHTCGRVLAAADISRALIGEDRFNLVYQEVFGVPYGSQLWQTS